MTNFSQKMAAAMTRIAGPGELSCLSRLSGGANMESWAFRWAARDYVLRRAPSEQFMADKSFGLADEAQLVRTVRNHGVKAPEVIGMLLPNDAMGSGYIMRRVDAEVAPVAILSAPPSALLTDIARQLANIHAIPPSEIPPSVPKLDPATGLAALKSDFLAFGGDRPVIALAIRWCEEHLPAAGEPSLVHGDFRMGNIMVGDEGLAAVLDWELAHLGDPHEDLAYGCMTVWRFGRLDSPAFGLGDLDDFFAAYEAAGGRPVRRDRFRFWLVYRTLWWALGCLKMGETWRTGADRNLERVVVGRRVSEQELDLLMLLETGIPEPKRNRQLPPEPVGEGPSVSGEPSTREIICAVREWLETAIKPKAEGHAKFEVAVAMNALGIAMRDIHPGAEACAKKLSANILNGFVRLGEPDLLHTLRRRVLEKCRVDSPKYPALARAAALWETRSREKATH